jgi:hypothetical protein
VLPDQRVIENASKLPKDKVEPSRDESNVKEPTVKVVVSISKSIVIGPAFAAIGDSRTATKARYMLFVLVIGLFPK